MKNQSISYFVKPSFDDNEKMFVDISWNKDRKQYLLMFQLGKQDFKRQWFDENEELKEILEESSKLDLALYVEGMMGLDGTRYEFQIGAFNYVTFSWWKSIPKEWNALQPIIYKIHQVINKNLKNCEQKNPGDGVPPLI